MVKKNNHIIAFFLLTFTCLPTVVFFSLQTLKLIVRHEMMERLEASNLEQITLAKKDVRWYEEGKEIIIGNTLFDVKSSRVKNDSIVFEGLFDRKESELKKKIDLVIDYQGKRSSSNTLIAAQLVFQLWDYANSEFALTRPTMLLPPSTYRTHNETLLLPPSTPPSPPPRTHSPI